MCRVWCISEGSVRGNSVLIPHRVSRKALPPSLLASSARVCQPNLVSAAVNQMNSWTIFQRLSSPSPPRKWVEFITYVQIYICIYTICDSYQVVCHHLKSGPDGVSPIAVAPGSLQVSACPAIAASKLTKAKLRSSPSQPHLASLHCKVATPVHLPSNVSELSGKI